MCAARRDRVRAGTMVGELQARRARQFVIALLLRARGKARAQDLAAALSVSTRTIARDCAELELLGVPVRAERGATGGFWLAESVRLDPAGFVALPGAGREQQEGGPPDDGEAANQAWQAELEGLRLRVRGLAEGLGERERADAEAALAALDLEALPGMGASGAEVLLTLRRALWRGRRVRLDYPTAGVPHTRDVDPLALVAREGVWYLAGYCHWRQDVRTFVVARISRAEALEASAPVARQAQMVGQQQGM